MLFRSHSFQLGTGLEQTFQASTVDKPYQAGQSNKAAAAPTGPGTRQAFGADKGPNAISGAAPQLGFHCVSAFTALQPGAARRINAIMGNLVQLSNLNAIAFQ